MRRRSRAASKRAKGQLHHASGRKAHKTPTRRAFAADLHQQLDQLRRERDELLQQQTATSEVLRVISRSAGELRPVFQAMLENAVRICGAKFGMLYLFEGGGFRTIAMHDVPRAFAEKRGRDPLVNSPAGPLSRVVRTRRVAHIADIRTEPGYAEGRPLRDLADLGGARTVVAVPMFKDDELVGAIVIYRQEVRLFTDKQIELLKSFAAQAVIAIENTRLLSELRESLEQQTATTEVLSVISSSPGALEPVFQAMLENGTRLCEAKFGLMWLREGDKFRCGALHNAPVEFAEARRREPVISLHPQSPMARAMRSKQVVHIADVAADAVHAQGNQPLVDLVKFGGARTLLVVPMLKDDEIVGTINIYSQEVRPFTDKQIELVKNFAAQAVIAIENARLLNELRESLQQQTATADVLKVISRSAFDLEVVFNTLLESATRLCEGHMCWIVQRDGEVLRFAASYGHTPEVHARIRDYFKSRTVPVDRGSIVGRAAVEAAVVHIPDVVADPEYKWGGAQKIGGYRAALGAPLLRDGKVIGVLFVAKTVPQRFTDKQIELVNTFADQAVIAIENTRLLTELRESLQQQTATADVLKVISRSTFDLQAVLDTLVSSATRLCEADRAVIRQRMGDGYAVSATFGFSSQQRDYLERHPPKLDRGSVFGRTILEGHTVHVPDIATDPEYERAVQLRTGSRAAVGVLLQREGVIIGALIVLRAEPRAFSRRQIELLETFADQAAIAIENMRLFNETREASSRCSTPCSPMPLGCAKRDTVPCGFAKKTFGVPARCTVTCRPPILIYGAAGPGLIPAPMRQCRAPQQPASRSTSPTCGTTSLISKAVGCRYPPSR
jgi:two-component system NtrC family sensor kinase